MILINLLPHREARRALRKRAFYASLGLASMIGVGVIVLWYGVLQQMTAVQQSRNQFLTAEIGQLEAQIKDIATIRAEIDGLKARQQSVEDLQANRNVPVYLLDELVKQTPEGVYLTAIRQTANTVAINGMSLTNERVSELLRNTAYNSPWLERPELVEIQASVTGTGRDIRRLYSFSIKVNLKRAAPAATPASAAAAARAAAKSASAQAT